VQKHGWPVGKDLGAGVVDGRSVWADENNGGWERGGEMKGEGGLGIARGKVPRIGQSTGVAVMHVLMRIAVSHP
jgi:hypothetical protein